MVGLSGRIISISHDGVYKAKGWKGSVLIGLMGGGVGELDKLKKNIKVESRGKIKTGTFSLERRSWPRRGSEHSAIMRK